MVDEVTMILDYMAQDGRREKMDLLVPTHISVIDLYKALCTALKCQKKPLNSSEIFLVTENPIMLLKGNRSIDSYNLRDGTIIFFKE